MLFLIELTTRRVEIAGIASTANGFWMDQIGRNLTDAVDGMLKGVHRVVEAVFRWSKGARPDTFQHSDLSTSISARR